MSSATNFHSALILTTLWSNSADNKFVIFFLFFPENRILQFMQIVETICMKCQTCFFFVCVGWWVGGDGGGGGGWGRGGGGGR